MFWLILDRPVGFTAIWALMTHILLRNPSKLSSIIFCLFTEQRLLHLLVTIRTSKFGLIERNVIMLSTSTLPSLVFQTSPVPNTNNGSISYFYMGLITLVLMLAI